MPPRPLRRTFRKSSKNRSNPWTLSPLEPRVMLAADAGAAVSSVAVDASLPAGHGSGPTPAQVGAAIPSPQPILLELEQDIAEHRRSVERIVFIDAAVEGGDVLTAAAGDAEVVLLSNSANPIDQISRTLAMHRDVQSIHIVSHGDSGKIELSGLTLDEAAVRANAVQIANWSRALSHDADILLYGCSVGAGSEGRSLMTALAEISGADVAASINLTGGALSGGDWQLEREVGRIEAGIAFEGFVLANYRYSLPIGESLVNFADFQGAEGISTNGGASLVDGVLQLTSDAKYQTGSAFLETAISLDSTTSFQAAFSFEMTGGAGEGGADGILFVLQNSAAGAAALGRGGSGVGYDRIADSIAVEFDTWKNGWDQFNDEIGVVAGGDIQNQIAQVQSPLNLNSGDIYYAWVDYDGPSQTLNVYVSDTDAKPGSAILTTSIDLENFAGDQFYAGFTASNYNRPNAHRILSWSMNVDSSPGGGGGPQPPAIGLQASSVTVQEGTATASIRVVRSGDISSAASVDYQTSDLSAVHDGDYGSVSGTLNFAANESFQDIEVSIVDDDLMEGNENFLVTLSNASGADLEGPSSTTVTIVDNEISLPFYADFQNSDGIVTNGGASIDNGVLQLTSDAKFQTGSAFFDTAIDLADDTSFQAAFSFEMIGGAGAGGADGILFVLQNSDAGVSALGRGGSGVGYDGIGNSLAIELDTWKNRWDLFNDEVGVVADGNIQNQIEQVAAPFDLNLGGVYYAWVDYDGVTQTLSVYVSETDSRPNAATLTTSVDLSSYVGDQFYAGFTASNYNRPNAHRILSWSLNVETPGSGGGPGGGGPGGGDPGGGDPGGGDPGGGDPGGGDPGGGEGSGLPLIRLQTSNLTVNEDAGNATVRVVRSGELASSATVNYQTFDQSALSGEDYTTTIGTAVFAAGQSSVDILVPIVDDDVSETTQAFTITIDNPTGAGLSAPRTATITILDDETPVPNYGDFLDSSGIVTNGGASIENGVLQLTSDAKFQTGSAFFDTAILSDEDTSFQAAFSFEMTGGAGAGGADGILFVLQNSLDGASSIGRGGSGVGYDGIDNSIAIELDTWKNGWDLFNDEVGVLTDGVIQNHVAQVRAPFNLNFGGVYYAWVDYNGISDTLSVYLSTTSTKPTAATLKTSIRLDDFVGDQFYAGFTSSNYDRPNAHRILSWSMNLEAPPADPPVNPSGDVSSVVVAGGFFLPTSIAWSPDGTNLYVSEKGGVVKVVRNGQQVADPIIDISAMVNSMADRGLLDIAIHPDLENNPYLYLLYTVDPPEVWDNVGHALAGPDQRGNRAGQLMRIELDASTNYTTMVEGTETILLGTASTWDNFNGFVNSVFNISEPPAGQNEDGSYIRDFINADSTTHSIGSLVFAADGSLFVSIGDGASYNVVDPRAVRVQDIDSLSGKILRIDPLTGQGLADNPFYNGDPDANRSKVYQLGLRNPFRIAVDDATGQLFIGDVGWTRWEEVNTGAPGANFGWPYYEGGQGENFITGGGYGNLAAAQEFYDSGGEAVSASIALSHAADGINAIIMGDVVRNGDLGEQYEGNVFFNDLGQGIVRNATIDANGVVTNMDVFATGAQFVVSIRQGPDGSLYFVDLLDGEIGKWEFV